LTHFFPDPAALLIVDLAIAVGIEALDQRFLRGTARGGTLLAPCGCQMSGRE
jgi:hypothetical protein